MERYGDFYGILGLFAAASGILSKVFGLCYKLAKVFDIENTNLSGSPSMIASAMPIENLTHQGMYLQHLHRNKPSVILSPIPTEKPGIYEHILMPTENKHLL